MFRIALRMLFGDRTKYITLVMSLAFATMLMNQQGAIFLGLLTQATGPLQNVGQADLWVVDPGTDWVAEYRPLSDQKVGRVRSVAGVAWAEPFFSNYAITELKNGNFKRVQILGLSRTTLAGRPPEMVEGRLEDLWTPDAIIVEIKSKDKLGGVNIGDTLKINDKRAVVVGFCKARQGFESNAIIYTTFDNATRFTPVGRKAISYILVKVKNPAELRDVQKRIDALGDVIALTTDEFRTRTMNYITVATGIGFNFGITIALGFVVGLLLSASVFYQFTMENLRQFATLKALGASGWVLAGMVMAQALVVGIIGYGIGVGLAGAFTIFTVQSESELSAKLPWELLVISLVAMLLTVALGSVLSLRRVIGVSPGAVFGSVT
ncbi:MAG: ABC transporter permease [Phycisphaeraceae bacterium]|nr:ABC transporter permease [Phycisphaeraceae bacterium]